MKHAWVADQMQARGDVAEAGKEHEQDHGAAIEKDGANDGIKERREKLINRLDRGARNSRGEEIGIGIKNLKAPQFTLNDKTMSGAKVTYEWWSKDKANSQGILDAVKKAAVKPTTQVE